MPFMPLYDFYTVEPVGDVRSQLPFEPVGDVRSQLPFEQLQQLESVMERDYQFFLQHPDKDSRVRGIFDVELVEAHLLGQDADEMTHVFVAEIAPGQWIRVINTDLIPDYEGLWNIQGYLRQQQQTAEGMRGLRVLMVGDQVVVTQKLRPKRGFGGVTKKR